MHKCFDEILEKVKEKVIQDSQETEYQDLKVDWVNGTFGIDMDTGKMSNYVSMPIEYTMRRIKKSGALYANLTRDQIGVKPTYCPFCGVKLSEESDSE